MGQRIQFFTAITAIVIVIGLAAPAAASNEGNRNTSLQNIVQEAQKMLQPFARQRNLTVTVEASGNVAVEAAEVERTRERVLNMLANAIALSPENNTVVVKLSKTQELSVFIGNDQVAISTERDIRDQAGNFFKVRSTAARGTELSTRFVNVTLSRVP